LIEQPPSGPRASSPTRASRGARGALIKQLRELWWVEGQNLFIEWRTADGKAERLPGLAAELVRPGVDAIVVSACGAPLDAARAATSSIPIVVTTCNEDLVAAGVIASLARPGGNITGQSASTF
jgi:putative ABC transport system substrate-binding protein